MRPLFLLFWILALNLLGEEQKIIKLTSLEWPPYTSASLPEQGASVSVVKAAFKAMGYELHVDFYPWKRAIALATIDSEYDGYFPEYYSKGIEQNFVFSKQMGESPLGFMELKKRPIAWEKLEDLKDHVIGTVQGYVNTERFDFMVMNETLKVDAVVDDLTNIKKMERNRIDVAVIDKYVMHYLLVRELNIPLEKSIVQFNPRVLEEKALFVCFRKGNEGERLRAILNEGLSKINYKQIQSDYLKGLGF